MKVLLINPPWVVHTGYGCRTNTRWPHVRKDKYLLFPIYLAYTVAVLEESNIEVNVIDAVKEEYDQKSFLDRVKAEQPDKCFLETSTPTINQDIENARRVKEELACEVYLFGAHVSTFHRDVTLEYSFVDGVIRGEFEHTIRDVALGKNFQEILGLTYSNNGRLCVNPDRPFIKDLDTLPFPARHYFDLKAYESHLYLSPSAMIIATRGCPFHCTYCLWPHVLYGHRQRRRSPENICDEIELLIDRYNVRHIQFDDDTFALNREYVISVCNEIIRRGYNKKISWNCFGHVNQDKEDMYYKMAKAGCVRIAVGIESGSQKILNVIKKGVNIKKAREMIKACRNAGIEVYCDFMVGFPYEDEEDIDKSIKTAIEVDPDFIQVSYAIPYPGTAMYAQGIKEGFLKYPEEWERYAACESVILNKIDDRKMKALYKKFWRKFYLRPEFIFRNVKKSLRSPSDFKMVMKGFISLSKRLLA